MSFYHLPGQFVADGNGTTYIIADSFSVMHSKEQAPLVYMWSEIHSVKIHENSISIYTDDGCYTIPSDIFDTRKQFLSAKAIASSSAAKYGVNVISNPEILPEKKLYSDYDIPDIAIFAQGEYNVKEIKSSLLLLLIGKANRIMWSVAIIAAVVALVLFQIFIGFTGDNWWYLLTGTFFCAVGAVAVTYIIMMTVAKARFAGILRVYSRYNDQVTFAICDEGFAACESDIYSPGCIIRWANKDTFVETGTMFVIMRKGKTILWIPKSLFSDEQLKRISDLLTLTISEK